jgi:hypothetical protein
LGYTFIFHWRFEFEILNRNLRYDCFYFWKRCNFLFKILQNKAQLEDFKVLKNNKAWVQRFPQSVYWCFMRLAKTVETTTSFLTLCVCMYWRHTFISFFTRIILSCLYNCMGRDSSVGIVTGYGLDGPGIESRWGEFFRTRPDRLCGPPSLPYNGYRVFPGGKAAGPWRWRTTPSSAEVK